jgi:WD40 repeat protein
MLASAGQASAAATPVIAAYERYVPGSGFDIGLINAQTGASLVIPGAVNTTADEFHPALTPNGRFLVFTRATLVPQVDGDVVPPASRQVLMLDRQTGTVGSPMFPNPDAGAGATIVRVGTTGAQLTYGRRVPPDPPSSGPAPPAEPVVVSGSLFGTAFSSNPGAGVTKASLGLVASDSSGTFVDIPHAATAFPENKVFKATTVMRFDEGNGNVTNAIAIIRPATGTPATLQNSVLPRHATPRAGDAHVAVDITTSSGTDIATLQVPGDTTAAPFSAVNTSDPERMPAWSPDAVQLGFVRTTGATPKRKLLLFDSTTGIQAIVNPAVDLGGEPPTPQLRDFQSTWGGLSLANTSGSDSVLISCGVACTGSLAGQATGTGVTLGPRVGGITRVGILIARVVGTRRLFGHRVLRIRSVGRVPLGLAKSRSPRFHWNGRVNGRRLAAGDYLLTFRALTRSGRVTSTSRSIRFSLTSSGRLTRVRLVK